MVPRRLRIPILLCYVGAVTALLLLPVPSPPGTPSHFDKLAHLLLVGGLSWLSWWTLWVGHHQGALAAVALAVAYAVVVEILQGLTTARTPELADALAGGFGAVIVGIGLRQRQRLTQEPPAP